MDRKTHELALLVVRAAEEMAEQTRAEMSYPKDIQEKAKQAAIEICGFESSAYDWTIIAQLLVDERNRCAKIANEWCKNLIWADGKPKKFSEFDYVAEAIQRDRTKQTK